MDANSLMYDDVVVLPPLDVLSAALSNLCAPEMTNSKTLGGTVVTPHLLPTCSFSRTIHNKKDCLGKCMT